MVFQIKEHHVKHDGGGRPLNMLNIPRIMILLIARNMFDDVRNIRVELVYSVLLYTKIFILVRDRERDQDPCHGSCGASSVLFIAPDPVPVQCE